MKAYKCDMCGKIMLKKDISYSLSFWKNNESFPDDEQDFDLCPACMERVEKVLGQTISEIKFMDEN